MFTNQEDRKKESIDFYSIKWFFNVRLYLFWSIIFFLFIISIVLFGVYPLIQQTIKIQEEIKQNLVKNELLMNKTQQLVNMDLSPDYIALKKADQILYSKKPIMEAMNLTGYIANDDATFVIRDNFEISPGLVSTISATINKSTIRDDESTELVDSAISSQSIPVLTGKEENFILFKISVTGEKEKVANYFMRLEKLAPLMTVANLQMSSRDEKRSNGQAEMLLHFYDPRIITVLEKPLPSFSFNREVIFSLMNQIEKLDIDLLQEDLIGGKENPFETPGGAN